MTLNIRINDDYKLTSDAMNVIVNKRVLVDPTKSPNWKKRKAEGASPELREDWREVSFHSTIEQALDTVVNKSVLDSEATTISELRNDIRKIRRDIERVLSE